MVSELKKNAAYWPEQVAIIGGGRWARVLTTAIDIIAPEFVSLSIHTPNNIAQMKIWAKNNNLGHRVKIFDGYPEFNQKLICPVIIANAARNHEKAIEWALSRRMPVLAEKPLTLNSIATKRLAEIAVINNTYLAASNVFLFASYIQDFQKTIAKCQEKIAFIRFRWSDPQTEKRGGETKYFDPRLTVFEDWMPHVVSILETIFQRKLSVSDKMTVRRGGSHVTCFLFLCKIPCEVELVRNGAHRQRVIDVTSKSGEMFKLDFSNEPAIKTVNGKMTSKIENCLQEESPVKKMLEAFFIGAMGGHRDERIDMKRAIAANEVIDQCAAPYKSGLSNWLSQTLYSKNSYIKIDMEYALRELAYNYDPDSRVPIEKRLYFLHQKIRENSKSPEFFKYKQNPLKLIKRLTSDGKLAKYLIEGRPHAQNR